MKALLGFASVAAVAVAVLLLHGAGHASSPFAVALANAAVKCPNITDATAHGLPAGSAPTATLSASCVLDFGIPKGDKGDTGPAGAQGAAGTAGTNGVSGYVMRVNYTDARRGSKQAALTATAKCPAGKKAVGGGVSVATDGGKSFPNVAITESQPTPNGNGWTAAIRRLPIVITPRPPTFTLTVTAVCALVP
jgi:hypothetical protein